MASAAGFFVVMSSVSRTAVRGAGNTGQYLERILLEAWATAATAL